MDFEIFPGSNVQFVFRIMYSVIFLGAFIWAGNVIIANIRVCYRRFFVEFPLRRRSKLAVEKARGVGTVAVFNEERGITAVCPNKDFMDCLYNETVDIAQTKDEGRKLRRSLTPIMVMPARTFTFADRDAGNKFVTGTEQDVELIFNDLIKKVTGSSRPRISIESLRYIRQILVRRDRRLLVPFVTEGHLPNGELMLSKKSQVELLGNKTLKEARGPSWISDSLNKFTHPVSSEAGCFTNYIDNFDSTRVTPILNILGGVY